MSSTHDLPTTEPTEPVSPFTTSSRQANDPREKFHGDNYGAERPTEDSESDNGEEEEEETHYNSGVSHDSPTKTPGKHSNDSRGDVLRYVTDLSSPPSETHTAAVLRRGHASQATRGSLSFALSGGNSPVLQPADAGIQPFAFHHHQPQISPLLCNAEQAYAHVRSRSLDMKCLKVSSGQFVADTDGGIANLKKICSVKLDESLLSPSGSMYSPVSPDPNQFTVPVPIDSGVPLHLSPKIRTPNLATAPQELKLKDIPVKFVRKHGSRDVDWDRVSSLATARFQTRDDNIVYGLSEAEMFHCVVELKPMKHGVTSTSEPSSPLLALSGSRQHSAIHSTTSTPPGSSKSWFGRTKARLRSLFSKKRSGTSESLLGDTTNPNFNYTDPYSDLLQTSDEAGPSLLHTSSSSFGATHTVRKAPPPAIFALKHYDTNTVDSPNIFLRLARHLTSTTSERMASHELFFYTQLSVLFNNDKCPFRVPKCYFAAALDRGDPGLLKYVCCSSGSGTVVTIAMEDMTRSGFSFEHSDLPGLFDADMIDAVIRGLACLHGSFWSRCHEPYLMSCKPATIPRFIHRCGTVLLERLNSNNDLKTISIRRVVKRWKLYEYTHYLKCNWVYLALLHTRENWEVIRGRAVRIILSTETIIHGDVHYQNLGFRGGMAGDAADIHSWQMMAKRFTSLDSIPHMIKKSSVDSIGEQASSGTMPMGPRQVSDRNPGQATSSTGTSTRKACFLDFQGSGPGSIAAELLYFICTSVPVTIDWEDDDTEEPTKNFSFPVETSLSPNPADNDYKVVDSFKSNKSNKASMNLAEVLEFDVSLIRTYHSYLPQIVRDVYSVEQLIHDVYILARHWAGCLTFDLNGATVEERKHLKRVPAFEKLISWGERTAERVFWMCAAIYAHVDSMDAKASRASNTRSAESDMSCST